MKDIIFLGPSVPLQQAQALYSADYRPPAKMGDVYQAASEKPRSIAIIDGFFESVPAVWHKEVLYAIDQGIPVYGGSSMGALRAAELHPFGMRGIGKIYQDYADGSINDDDEVAVSHATAEDNYRCVSVAMINIRYGMAAAVQSGCVNEAESAALVAASKARFYPERNWQSLLNDAEQQGLADEKIQALKDFLAEQQPDQKRDDALAVIQEIASLNRPDAAARLQAHEIPEFHFEHTSFWEMVQTYCNANGASHEKDGAQQAQFERLRNHVRLFDAQRRQLKEQALLLFLAEQEMRRLGIKAKDDREALRRFRSQRGLSSPAQLAQWLQANRCSKNDCLALARQESMLTDLGMRHLIQVDKYLNAALKLSNRYGEVADEVAKKWQFINEQSMGAMNEDDIGSFDEVARWYQQHFDLINQDLEQHAAELGIGSAHQWREEVYAHYFVQHEA